MLRRMLIVVLALALIAAGMYMAYGALEQMRENIISQHGEKLADVVNSIDRSAEGLIDIYRGSLEYVTGRRGFTEAVKIWKDMGDAGELLFRMEESLVSQNLPTRTFLAIENGSVLLSIDGNTGYNLPNPLTDVFICTDEEQAAWLGISVPGEEVSFAVLVDLSVLCDYLAESCAVNEADRMLLIDGDRQVLICRREGKTMVKPLTEELLEQSPARMLTWQAVGTDIKEVSHYKVEEQDGSVTMGYALLGNGGARNGFFTICMLDTYDVHLLDLKKDTVQLISCCGIILLGLLLMISCFNVLFLKSCQAEREIAQLMDRQKMLERINEQTQQLAHHQRLEMIGTLTSSISHEFNNLLTPIMSYSLLTLEKLPADEVELYDNVLEIYNASQKAKTIISRLSDLSRKSSPRSYHEASVDELVKKSLDIAMPAKPEQVEVKLNLNCWDLRIVVNEIQICQMLLNLMINAFQAMEHGGVLEIDTTYDDDHIQIYVTDTGCGIPEDIRDRIFDPFFTTKEPGMGTGLGLAIVAQVVEDHRGTIEVSSSNGGTRFKVCLPRQTEVK